MGNLRVKSVDIKGVQLINMSHGGALAFKELGVRAAIQTNIGDVDIRISDFKGVALTPSLHPGNFQQKFVSGPVLEKADAVIQSEPAVVRRIIVPNEAPINFNGLIFKHTPTDAMVHAMIKAGGSWPAPALVPFDEISISPVAGVLNYGQGLFEGMKAYRTEKGKIVLFRPFENARRAQNGARRLGLTPVPEDIFMDAVKQVVRANERWIPPLGKGSLYIRPLLVGSGPVLGVAPAPENTFLIYVSPVGPYFKGGLETIKLIVSEENHRATPGGTGNVKAIGNYAPGMVPAQQAKDNGYKEVIYLDAREHEYVEEVGAANFFAVVGKRLYTSKLTGTILPGITRDSVIRLAPDLGYEVVETLVTIDFAMQADEAFCTGTAAVISPIGAITHGDRTAVFNNLEVGPVSRQLYEKLTAIQEQREADTYGWVVEI